MTPIIQVNNLVKHYAGINAVNGISFSIAEGTCFGLLGPNGAGKTTTIEIMEGIKLPTSGQILYKNAPIGPQFKEEAGIQFQATSLQDFLTVKETLRLFHRLYKKPMNPDELIEICALGEFLNRDTKKLSGGQKQRLLLAIALINDPEIVFLDEPTTGLDPHARRNFWDLIRRIKANNKSIILTTHYMEEAYDLCDEIVIMDKGQIIAQDSPVKLLKSHYDDILIVLPEEDFPLSLETLPVPAYHHQGNVIIHANDVHETIQLLINHNIPLSRLEIRSRTLDDLFLELTGKELRA